MTPLDLIQESYRDVNRRREIRAIIDALEILVTKSSQRHPDDCAGVLLSRGIGQLCAQLLKKVDDLGHGFARLRCHFLSVVFLVTVVKLKVEDNTRNLCILSGAQGVAPNFYEIAARAGFVIEINSVNLMEIGHIYPWICGSSTSPDHAIEIDPRPQIFFC